MKLSVIMPVYNNAAYLEAAVRSILNQTYPEFEFIILDDASSDGSPAILERLAREDDRIRFYRNETNLGIPVSRNKLLDLATGEYVACMDSDDIARPERFERQMAVLAEEPDIDVIFTDTILIDDQGRTLCKAYRPKSTEAIIRLLPFHNYINQPSTILRRQAALDAGGYDLSYRTGSDTVLWKKLLQDKATFRYLAEPLLQYRINPDSVRARRQHSYPYKLAKVCLSNGDRQGARQRLSSLEGRERLDILIRLFLPAGALRRVLYLKNYLASRKS